MNEIKQNYKEISKNGLIENNKSIILNKFGFFPSCKQIDSEKKNNNIFLLSKSSINNSKDKSNNVKLKLSFSGTNLKQNNIQKKTKISQSCASLINNNKKYIKQSRNYNQNNSNLISNNINSKFNSSYFIYSNKMLKTMQNNYNNVNSVANNINKSHNRAVSTKNDKNYILNEKNRQNKSFINQINNKIDEIIFNVKPIIKKNDNLIHNKLWPKLLASIDQSQNDKINKLKIKYMNKINININTNININIKNNIINCQKENTNNNRYNEENNISYSNLTTNNVNININNNNNSKNNTSKKYLPNISLNDITNYNPPEKDNSTISIIEENGHLKKENKKHFNKIIQEREKEKRHKGCIEQINSQKIYIKEKSKNKSLNKKNTLKRENKFHNIYNSSIFDESHNENIINDKREIQYCDSDTFKTSSNKNINEKEKEKENYNIMNKNEDNISDINEPSFIGDNNSYHRINRKAFDKDLSEKEDNYKNESDYTESNNRNIFNYNNKYNNISHKNQNNSTHNSENIKIYRLLSKNFPYNVSTREIHDEAAKLIEHENPNVNYNFISEIEKKNINIKNLNKKKFLNLKDNCVFNILSFGIDIYLPLVKCDKYIKKKINKSLNNIFENIIKGFQFKYREYLEVIHYKFEHNQIKSFYNKNDYILDLILKCKIISKKYEKSIEISCNYMSNKKKYDYMWKFDLQKKSKINQWITTEINTMKKKNYHKTISYTSQVSSFSYGDEMQIQINIFNNNSILEPSTLEWCPLVISPASTIVYENTKYINKISFDPLRACEVEKQVLMWHDKFNNEQIILFEEIKEIFKKFFKIKNIYFDKSKYYFYKLVMIPYKLGLLYRNKFCNFDINIIDLDIPAKNEIQCIYLINTNNYTNKMDIRLGSTLILYIIDIHVS